MKWLRLVVLFFAANCFNKAIAQPMYFETLNTKSGLSSNEVLCLYEDKQHLLWIGTRDGLNRFDGMRFEIFRNNPEDTNSLSGNIIMDVVQDAEGVFWIATQDGGLTRYNPNAVTEEQFHQFKHSPKDSTTIATNRLRCLYNWDSTYLVIGCESYTAIFLNKKTLQFTYWQYPSLMFGPKFATPVAKPNNWIQHFAEYDGWVYMSLLTSGRLIKAEKSTGHIVTLHQSSSDITSINNFWIERDKIWLCSWNPGVFMQENKYTGTAQKVLPVDDLFNAVCNFENNYLLAGSRSTGLYVLDKSTGNYGHYQRSVVTPHTIPSNKISSILVDSRGIVWVGTMGGIAKFDKNSWIFREEEFAGPEQDFSSYCPYRFPDGSVAVNTTKGMFLSDPSTGQFRALTFKNRNRTIVPDYLYPITNDEYWLGTEISFFKWKKGSPDLDELKIEVGAKGSDLYTNNVYQVKQFLPDEVDGEKGLWMPVLGYGISYYVFSTGQLLEFSGKGKGFTPLGNLLSRRLAKDSKGNIWLATAGGLYMWSRKNKLGDNNFVGYVNEPGNKNSIPFSDINDVHVDERDHVWFTGTGNGLAEFDGQKFYQYFPENPASSRAFSGMYWDKSRRIWIITKNGLEVFDRDAKKFLHVDVNDGALNNSIAAYFSNEQDGLVSFVASNRLFSFRPESMKFNFNYPNLYLADMNVFGKSYLHEALQGEVALKARERFINFTISAVQFSRPQTVRFQYKLEGLDEDWTNSDDGEIKYTNLPWGHFKLLGRVTNPSGHFGGEKVLAQFVIATPFYATWWFIVLCIITISALTYAGYRYRINQLLALQRVRNKIARDLHDDIGSTLGSISFFSEAAKQQLEQSNTSGTEKMLGKIGETSREMIDNMSDIVWSVNPQNDSVKKLVERMRVFAGDLIAHSSTMLHFESDKNVDDMRLSMEQRKNVFLIFKETIYNSVKYAECKNIYVSLSKVQGVLKLNIKDDGKGFDVNNYTSKNGNGVKNMKYRAEEVGAVITIQSQIGKGTETVVEIDQNFVMPASVNGSNTTSLPQQFTQYISAFTQKVKKLF
ncbi:MAG: two-component regulator propeller domain-containing protein [Chitinophagales bacterium]